MEGIVSHLLTAFYLTRWLRTVPLRTLAAVFETASKLQDLAAFAASPEQQGRIDQTLRRGQEKRLALVRWDQGQRSKTARSKALARRQFDEAHREIIEKIIAAELDSFHGAEAPGCGRERTLRRRIAGLALKGHGLETHGKNLLRRCLGDHLLHYQIQNNRYVLGRETIPVRALRGEQSRVERDCPAVS